MPPKSKSREKDLSPTTHYVCQIYAYGKVKRGPKPVVIEQTIECRNAHEAANRAERSFEKGRVIGADAYSVIFDPASEEVSEPKFLARWGVVPQAQV